MSIFGEAVADMFSDPNLAVAAIYTPVAGAAIAVRAILSRPDVDTGLLQTGTVAPTSIAEIQTSQVPVIEEGAALAIGVETFVIRSAKRDVDRLVWRCQLRKA